jgi:hypothetical protein
LSLPIFSGSKTTVLGHKLRQRWHWGGVNFNNVVDLPLNLEFRLRDDAGLWIGGPKLPYRSPAWILPLFSEANRKWTRAWGVSDALGS